MDLVPFDVRSFGKDPNEHSKTLHRNICIPSTAQSYSLCVEFMKRWFISLFDKNPFKSIYVDGKNIYDDWRRLSAVELLKRQRPALAIVPNIDWTFNNDNLDLYQFGTKLYQTRGLFKNSFYQDRQHHSYLGIMMETLFMEITFRMRLETRSQEMDMFKFVQLAARVGSTYGQDVDLDFHVPYDIMIALAQDAGFEVIYSDDEDHYPRIKNVKAFLAHLNTHSQIPFLYKMRAINGKNEFFIRMQRMYIHVRSTNLSADDGEREGMLTNNYNIELECEVRFPAPRMYAYYSKGTHELRTIYTAWDQPDGSPVTLYTFKAIPIASENRYGWPLYMHTEYDQPITEKGKILVMDCHELIDGDVGELIKDCLEQGLSPSIFYDLCVINGGELVKGCMNWETLTFTSYNPVRSLASYIGIYLDMNYINTALANKRGFNEDRVTESKHPNSRQAVAERGEELH